MLIGLVITIYKFSIKLPHPIVVNTNPDYKIKQWILDAKRLGIQLRVLKKNPAFELYW